MATLFQGKNLSISQRDSACVELCFDAAEGSANIFNRQTSKDLADALDFLEQQKNIKGLLITSAKSAFIAGADINEFGPVFSQGSEKITEMLNNTNKNFNRLEDLPFPTVVAINGYALGGGFEFSLACDLLIGTATTLIGLPETRLGIMPGWGGSVRLPRVVGIETAVEWMATGKHYSGKEALKAGVLDGFVDDPAKLVSCAFETLERCARGELDYYQQKRIQKKSPLSHNPVELTLSITTTMAYVAAKSGRHYPAPTKVVDVVQRAAGLGRDEALKVETQAFCELAQTPQAIALSGIFVSDQFIIKKAKKLSAQVTRPIAQAAVLGAGIMGGGIAYQSAFKGIPVKMKDVAQSGLDLGMAEANKLLSKRVSRGKMKAGEMGKVLASISPTLQYAGFGRVDLVVEAVVENADIKRAVLSEVEQEIKDDAVIATNTSTISVDSLASTLKRPENFCGMHFFNPVHAMPLVEVIKGQKSSDKTIAKTVAYALAMGKKPVVVKDCPGFLVNRVLFPYLAGFAMLLRDGADFTQVDKVMEAWGWPMGPAFLMDVIGIDTCIHAEKVMAKGFPDRMKRDYPSAAEKLFGEKYLGQKTGQGFYVHQKDKKGKLQKSHPEKSQQLISAVASGKASFSKEEILARMMVPMVTELARCLEEGIVETVAEADMALVYGLGFPPFHGGIFRWLDSIGLDRLKMMAAPNQSLGPLYQLTPGLEEKIKSGSLYYPNR